MVRTLASKWQKCGFVSQSRHNFPISLQHLPYIRMRDERYIYIYIYLNIYIYIYIFRYIVICLHPLTTLQEGVAIINIGAQLVGDLLMK